MQTCKCGSYAINHSSHGRDGSDGDLCDVCYWRTRADQLNFEIAILQKALTDAADDNTADTSHHVDRYRAAPGSRCQQAVVKLTRRSI